MSRIKNLAFDAALGARIRQARTAAGLPQGALGERVGVSFQQVQKYEKGADRISVEALLKIASVLGLDLQDLVDADVIALARPAPPPAAEPLAA